jgi:hypothetical protein
MSKILPWLLSAIGVVALLIAAPFAVILPAGILLGGASAGTTLLVVGLTLGFDNAGRFDPSLYWVPAALSSSLAAFGTIRGAVHLFRTAELPSVMAAAAEGLKYLLTLHLAFQIGLGSAFAAVAVLVSEGVSTMSVNEALVVSLFSVFVFIVSTTFTSYFMRSLIPWRKEHPRFSNAVAYTLSTLLGLIAATYAFAGKNTFSDAGHIGATLYQASVAFATIGATLVGAYVAVLERRHRSSNHESCSDENPSAG